MNQQFWDRMAGNYDDEIFDSLKSDRRQIIRRYIQQCGSKNSLAIDFGCGVEKYLPLLSGEFRQVVAIDLSPKCLEQARAKCSSAKNIRFVQADMADLGNSFSKARFVLCVNMLIMPSAEKRDNILKGISRHLNRGGHLVLVAPSLESALYSYYRLQEWNRRSKRRHAGGCALCGPRNNTGKFAIADGALNLDGVATKHFLKEELIDLLGGVGFEVLAAQKVEYAWSTEFGEPARRMKAPHPWDWLVFCRKR